MAVLRYLFTMDDHIPATRITVFSRGAIVNGAQGPVNAVTVHDGHDLQVGHKFLYGFSRTNILTNRVFTVTAKDATSVTFSGAPTTFTDKCQLVPLGTETGGVLQDDGTYSPLNWDGSTVAVYQDPHLDSAFTSSAVPVEPGGEVGFFSETSSVWCVALATSGKPLRTYIASQSDASADITTITNQITEITTNITNITTGTTPTPGPVLSIPTAPYFWYKADAIDGLSNGANVVTWPDSSGNGHTLTAAGATTADAVDSIRPKWYAATHAAEAAAGGLTALPMVGFEASSATGGHIPYFTIADGTLSLPITTGWTLMMILRDYISDAGLSYLIGNSDVLSDPVRILQYGATAGAAQFKINQGGTNQFCCDNYAHVVANATECVVIRCAASTGVLQTWVNGALQTNVGDPTHVSLNNDVLMRYLGRWTNSGATVGIYGKGLGEIVGFASAVTDAEVQAGSDYMLARAANFVVPAITANVGTWPVPTAATGNDTACVANTIYFGSIFVPMSMTVTGVQYLVGGTGGTSKVIASIHGPTGIHLASSALAGTVVGTAAQVQQLPLSYPLALAGPGFYYIALTFDTNGPATFMTVPAHCQAGSGMRGNSASETFGTPATFTAPTAFTANKVPVASLY